MRGCGLIVIMLALVVAGAAQGDFEELTLETAGLNRTISGTVNILKTTRLTVGDTQLLDQPSVEVMLELEANGERVVMVPGDFDIKAVDTAFKNKEQQTSIELRSHVWGYPVTIYVDYYNDERNQYQDKSITINPSKLPTGAVIKRVTIESLRFVDAVVPVSASESGFANDAKSAFAVIEPKSGKGLCWDWPAGVITLSSNRTLSAYVEPNVPLEKGFKTERLTLGAVYGKPGAAFGCYRQMLLEKRYPTLAKNAKFLALRKQFRDCFAACQYLPPCAEDGSVDAEGRIANGKGFVLLFNRGAQSKNAVVALSSRALGLSGEVKLSDWSELTKPVDLGLKKADDKLRITVPANGYKIIGVNVT